ncbi:MAG: Crp/Fnr family transcriptional regulator [Chloroflexi bacterium]|nr:Crp/Fnr family transcriptional regulator [Chloroflexota bacterium]
MNNLRSVLTLDHSIDFVSQVALFDGFEAQELEWVNAHLNRDTFREGSTIITEGQAGHVVYIVHSGSLKVYALQVDGTEVVLSIIGPGDVVGEMSLVDESERSASVVTLEDSDLLWMERSSFEEGMQRIPRFAQNMARLLSERVRLSTAHIRSLAALHVNGRVARQLLAFAKKYGRKNDEGGVLIPMRLTQRDIAGLVGASRKRVNQAVVEFKRRELISVNENSHLVLHNVEALKFLTD